MPREKFLLGSDDLQQHHGTGTWTHVKKLLKLLFSSYGILASAMSLMAMSVLNGDAFGDFTGGLIVNIGVFLTAVAGPFAYPVAMLISALVLVGPIHYYAAYEMLDIFIIITIVFLVMGFILGRMFKHPAWGFMAGIVVMLSYVITITSAMGIINAIAGAVLGAPVEISGILYAMIEGIYGMNTTMLFTLSVLENGSYLGLFGAFWGVVFMKPKKKEVDLLSISFNCDPGKICKV